MLSPWIVDYRTTGPHTGKWEDGARVLELMVDNVWTGKIVILNKAMLDCTFQLNEKDYIWEQ